MRHIVFVLCFTACGSEQPATGELASAPVAYAVTATGDLPTCDESTRSQVFFVENEKAFFVCRADGWGKIDLRGQQGATGAPGATGQAGPSGKDWSVSSIFAASIYCGGQLETTGIWFNYDVGLLKSGDVLVTGSIRDGAWEISQTTFYASSQNGAATAAVIFQDDLQGTYNGGYWTLSLNRTTLVTTILYQDADAAGGSITWTMTADKCVANTYQ